MKKFLYIVLIITIFAVGVGGALYFVKNKPKPKKRPIIQHAQLVETLPVKRSDFNITFELMGTVKASKTVELRSRVVGEVMQTSHKFIPGNLLKKGEKLLNIDRIDYELSVIQKESDVKKAAYELKLENAQGAIAAEELEFLGESVKQDYEDLLLRKPNLLASNAKLQAAKATLKKAQLDLQRTTIKAPFNASLQEIHVNVGSRVRIGDKLVTLVNSDTFWIEALIDLKELKYIKIPTDATIISSSGSHYQAKAITLEHDLDSKARMAKILFEVQDPLALKEKNSDKVPLFIGDYVTLNVRGTTLKSSFKIPRYAVHEGNKIYIFGKNKKLRIVTITILHAEQKFIYTTAPQLQNDDLLITSPLATAVEGMRLRVRNDAN
jgi:RND family efflux transporter MFP subunit